MTLREATQARVARLPDAALPEVLSDLEAPEARQHVRFSQAFSDFVDREPSLDDLSDEEATKLATRVARAYRQEHRR